MTLFFSVSSENIPGIDFLFYIVQTAVVAVGNDGVGLLFEVLQIVYDYRSEESTAVFQCGFVDDDAGSLSSQSFCRSIKNKYIHLPFLSEAYSNHWGRLNTLNIKGYGKSYGRALL